MPRVRLFPHPLSPWPPHLPSASLALAQPSPPPSAAPARACAMSPKCSPKSRPLYLLFRRCLARSHLTPRARCSPPTRLRARLLTNPAPAARLPARSRRCMYVAWICSAASGGATDMQEVAGGVSDGQGRWAPRLCAVMLERECQGNGEQWGGGWLG
ncbi:hypothetical protein K523DRAFT_422348, partial [Schizophyllum commune Tattone D]